ncbi:MAG: hypothetical protein A3H92_07995 [Rhodospirillales bacterium RIFCSPLOWO2_02_FULL_58_16]|nr:MAG: hypothetical protein A3H92_07995 [Rhodospirillales bacterium RIFCSPLOWO2_02_FULL_58_16]
MGIDEIAGLKAPHNLALGRVDAEQIVLVAAGDKDIAGDVKLAQILPLDAVVDAPQKLAVPGRQGVQRAGAGADKNSVLIDGGGIADL